MAVGAHVRCCWTSEGTGSSRRPRGALGRPTVGRAARGTACPRARPGLARPRGRPARRARRCGGRLPRPGPSAPAAATAPGSDRARGARLPGGPAPAGGPPGGRHRCRAPALDRTAPGGRAPPRPDPAARGDGPPRPPPAGTAPCPPAAAPPRARPPAGPAPRAPGCARWRPRGGRSRSLPPPPGIAPRPRSRGTGWRQSPAAPPSLRAARVEPWPASARCAGGARPRARRASRAAPAAVVRRFGVRRVGAPGAHVERQAEPWRAQGHGQAATQDACREALPRPQRAERLRGRPRPEVEAGLDVGADRVHHAQPKTDARALSTTRSGSPR